MCSVLSRREGGGVRVLAGGRSSGSGSSSITIGGAGGVAGGEGAAGVWNSSTWSGSSGIVEGLASGVLATCDSKSLSAESTRELICRSSRHMLVLTLTAFKISGYKIFTPRVHEIDRFNHFTGPWYLCGYLSSTPTMTKSTLELRMR